MEYNDYELVSLAQENDELATEILYKKYNNILVKKSKKIYRILKRKGLDINDIIQEAMIGFQEAIMGFNQDDNALFYTFVNICVDRQLNSLVVKYGRSKYQILNNVISFEYETENGLGLHNFFYTEVTPEYEFFDSDKFDDFRNMIKDALTYLEDYVFELKVVGFAYGEISSILDMDIKDVYNAIDRIKLKINKILNK